jgi:hypothetical protein
MICGLIQKYGGVEVLPEYGFYQDAFGLREKGPSALVFKSKRKAVEASKFLNSVDRAMQFRKSGQFEYRLLFHKNGIPFIFG